MNEQEQIEAGSMDDFIVRFTQVCDEAKAYGIDSVFGLVYQDRLSELDDFFGSYIGNHTVCLGAAVKLVRLLNED
jgi:hypothetical protein